MNPSVARSCGEIGAVRQSVATAFQISSPSAYDATAPWAFAPGDADAVLAAGVTREALIDAIRVCALFNMIVRLADSFGWEVPPPEAFAARGRVLLESGYRLRTADEIRAL